MTISVIIPAFNASRWLPSAVASVCARRGQPRDCDCGRRQHRRTRDLCRHSQRGFGMFAARTAALPPRGTRGWRPHAGEWLLFLDADDVLLPDALATLIRDSRSSPAGVVYGFCSPTKGSGHRDRLHGLPYAVGEPPAPAEAHFWWTPDSHSRSGVDPRSLNEAVGGFDENFRQVEDANTGYAAGDGTFAHCDRLVLDKTYTPTSLGQQQAGSIWFRLQLQRKFLLWCERKGIDTGFLGATPAISWIVA